MKGRMQSQTHAGHTHTPCQQQTQEPGGPNSLKYPSYIITCVHACCIQQMQQLGGLQPNTQPCRSARKNRSPTIEQALPIASNQKCRTIEQCKTTEYALVACSGRSSLEVVAEVADEGVLLAVKPLWLAPDWAIKALQALACHTCVCVVCVTKRYTEAIPAPRVICCLMRASARGRVPQPPPETTMHARAKASRASLFFTTEAFQAPDLEQGLPRCRHPCLANWHNLFVRDQQQQCNT
eukprot:587087-Pelagomonas_calceolata.AAC.1